MKKPKAQLETYRAKRNFTKTKEPSLNYWVAVIEKKRKGIALNEHEQKFVAALEKKRSESAEVG
jgi:hypothetical protein